MISTALMRSWAGWSRWTSWVTFPSTGRSPSARPRHQSVAKPLSERQRDIAIRVMNPHRPLHGSAREVLDWIRLVENEMDCEGL